MYEAFFQLKTRPFPSTPRTELYYPASAIEASRQTLARCIERGAGPGLLVGGPGTGKSLVCGMLAKEFGERFQLVKLDHARFCTRRALLQAILFELHLPYRGLDEGELRLALIDFVKSPEADREGLLLLVDEAQTLSARLIEEIRMIGNVIVAGQPRLRLVLSGNTALEERLTSVKLESFNQRIAARCYLQPLNYDETAGYIQSQTAAAGGEPSRMFADDAWQAVYHASGGIPRLINQVCDHALLLAATRRRMLDAALIEEAWADLQQLPLPWPSKTEQDQTAANTVVEFGSLATDETALADQDDHDEVGDCEGGDCEMGKGDSQLAGRSASGREIIDLAGQLDEIELHVAEWEAVEVSSGSDPAPSDADEDTADVPPPRTALTARTPDPFDDCFEEEEEVLDHYASLEAQSRRQGRTELSPQELEFTAALETIFQPLTEAGPTAPADRNAAVAPAADTAAAKSPSSPPPAREAIDEPVKTQDQPRDQFRDASGDESGDASDDEESPVTLQVEALRTMPPDDSDLILVLDAEAQLAPLSRTPGKAHRQEYRRLFTQLRES